MVEKGKKRKGLDETDLLLLLRNFDCNLVVADNHCIPDCCSCKTYSTRSRVIVQDEEGEREKGGRLS
jgi:hypothetical protein